MTPLFRSHDVRRWHANTDWRLRESGQTNGHHAARCLTILFELYRKPPVDLVKAVLLHDAHEKITGDLPYDVGDEAKAVRDRSAAIFDQVHGLPVLEGVGRSWVKLVDRMDAYLFAQERTPERMGEGEWVAAWDTIVEIAQDIPDATLARDVIVMIGPRGMVK